MASDRFARFLIHKSPAIIDAALRDIVRSAYDNVSLFRDKLDAVGITPSAVRSRRDLRKIPVTSRDYFCDCPTSEYTNRNVDLSRCHKSCTSGTTGTPLDVYMSRSEGAYRKLVLFNAIRKNLRLSLPLRIVEVGTGVIGITMRRHARRTDPVHVSHISRALPIDKQLELLIRARPHIVTGHPSCLELVAEEISGRSLGFAPRLVMCRGELLSDNTRSTLRERFGCKTVDYYSCDEVGNIAWECPVNEHRLHISTDGCVVEVVDEDGVSLPSESEGSILVTNLFNRTMPFIRYCLGDRGSLLGEDDVRCSCGYVGPSLVLLAGREEDYWRLPNGRKVSPRVISSHVASALVSPGRDYYYAKRYQCIQETRDTVRVQVLLADRAPSDLSKRITRAIKEISSDMECLVEFVEALPSLDSRKQRSVISKLRVL